MSTKCSTIHDMIKRTTILIVLIICSSVLFSQSKIDSSINKPYKISKEEFLIQYNKNDTTEELINLFFNRRNFGFSTFIALPILSTALISYADNYDHTYYQGGLITPVYTILSTFFVILSGPPLLTISSINCIKYNRRYLYKIIIAYNNGQPIPKNINKKIVRRLTHKQNRQDVDDVYK